MNNLTQFFNDRGEGVMIPDDMMVVQRMNLLWPKWISELKEIIFKQKNVQRAIDLIKVAELNKEEKSAILWIASSFRLKRNF